MDPNLSQERNLPDAKKYGAIEYRLEVVQNAVEQSAIKGNVECLAFIHKAMQVWNKGSFRDFTLEKRQEIADILHEASGTLERGTPIRQPIQDIMQLLLPPQFVSLCNDILELWMYSSNENETLMDNLGLCGKTWKEAEGRGRVGSLTIQKAKKIFAVLLEVVHTLQKEPDMKINIRMQYVVDFIMSVRTDLERRATKKHASRQPDSVFLYVKTVMTTYAPPNAPPALHVETVAEEGEEGEEEEPRYRLYLKIEHKLKIVHLELEESGIHGECLILIQQALQVWPGLIKDLKQDKMRDIAAILEQTQETLDAEGTGIWHQIEEIIQLLVPPGTMVELLAPVGRRSETVVDAEVLLAPVGRRPEKTSGENILYLDIGVKMRKLRNKLRESGLWVECLAFVQEALTAWPTGGVKLFTEDLKRDIAVIC
jgi:hypothetical protein